MKWFKIRNKKWKFILKFRSCSKNVTSMRVFHMESNESMKPVIVGEDADGLIIARENILKLMRILSWKVNFILLHIFIPKVYRYVKFDFIIGKYLKDTSGGIPDKPTGISNSYRNFSFVWTWFKTFNNKIIGIICKQD